MNSNQAAGPGTARERHRRGQPAGDRERSEPATASSAYSTVARPRGLRRQAKVLLGVAALVTCVAAFAAYLYVHYIDVVRYSAEQGRVTVERAELGRLGTVLVTNKGFALYTFPPDAAQHVTCTGDCASAWPPLTLHTGQTAAAVLWVRACLAGDGAGSGRRPRCHLSRMAAIHLPRRCISRSGGLRGQGRRRRVLVRDPPVRTDRQPVAAQPASIHHGGTELSCPQDIRRRPRHRTPRRYMQPLGASKRHG